MKEIFSIVDIIFKAVHVGDIFEVFIFLFLFFGWNIYGRSGSYLIMWTKSIFLLVKFDWKIAKIWPFAPEIKIVIHNDGRLQRGLNEKKSQIVTNLQKSAPDMPTSPSNQVCNQLELWKLVLKKYLNRGISVSSNALGGYP